MPGRALIAASLLLRWGASDEPQAKAGATVLATRGLTEGTERYDAIALTEAAERLGASVHAEAGWDAISAGFDVPATRIGQAMDLLAEVIRHPVFPANEIERIRDERLTDLIQAKADPRRRADEVFTSAIYSAESPYRRSAGGVASTVEGITADDLRAVHKSFAGPQRGALIVAGEVDPDEVVALAAKLFGDWEGGGFAGAAPVDAPAETTRRVRVVHRPGAVQTEIRLGHPGLPRRTPDYHAVTVMSAILGGLFNSRLNMNLREEKGYTYGAGAGFDLRRGRGPFSARAAVNTEVTVPAIVETLKELDRMRQEPVTDAELRAARDYLIGVFPLRFETPGPVVGSLASLYLHGLPDDELATYRASIEAVTAADVQRVASKHIRPDEAALILVGDHDQFGAALEALNWGPITVETDEVPAEGTGDAAAEAGPLEGEGEGS